MIVWYSPPLEKKIIIDCVVREKYKENPVMGGKKCSRDLALVKNITHTQGVLQRFCNGGKYSPRVWSLDTLLNVFLGSFKPNKPKKFLAGKQSSTMAVGINSSLSITCWYLLILKAIERAAKLSRNWDKDLTQVSCLKDSRKSSPGKEMWWHRLFLILHLKRSTLCSPYTLKNGHQWFTITACCWQQN